MTVMLVLFTFVLFLVIDHFYSKRHAVQPILQVAPGKRESAALPRLQPSLVAGFAVPENMRYHPGHTWAISESANLVRVGIDDFATKLLGTIDGISLPQRGQWVRQGQKILTMHHKGAKVDMVSPIEGSVTDINEAVAKDPLGQREPGGHQHRRPIEAMELEDIFPHQMNHFPLTPPLVE